MVKGHGARAVVDGLKITRFRVIFGRHSARVLVPVNDTWHAAPRPGVGPRSGIPGVTGAMLPPIAPRVYLKAPVGRPARAFFMRIDMLS